MSLLHTTRSIYVKHKVLLGFLLTLAVLSGAAYLTFQSYQRILSALQGTAKPQQELSLISQILLNISQVEASNYAYQATSKQVFLEELALQARELQQKMEALRGLAPWDSLHKQKIDSIEVLLEDFPEKVRSLIALRKELGKGNNLREVQKMIRRQLENPKDTSLLSSDTLRNILVQEITKEQNPLPAPYEPEKKKGEEKKKIEKSRKGLFGRKYTKEENVEEAFVIDEL